ncbi:MAG TPA: NAD(P)H-binding protein [Mycobacteriales bacterium]|nr:NAD(P)H-binding protein [Mycobacteriales bacterium]
MRKIGLLGATGYTGRLTATEFALREMPVRLGARSEDRLARVDAAEAAERVVVDTTDRDSLDRFMAGLDIVISTVGPFELLGRPVVDAAVAAGVHYIDSTGEPDFMTWAYDTHSDAATAVVPACGYDYVPSDCAASIAASMLDGEPDRIDIGYSLKGMKPTRGTARSALGAVLAQGKPQIRRSTVDGRPALQVPLGDLLTTGRWAGNATVTANVAVSNVVHAIAPVMGPATGPLLKLGAPLLRRVVERMPEGPTDEMRAGARATVSATAARGSQTAKVSVDVNDVYAFTALALVEFALKVEGKGPMSPSEAVEPEDMLDALSGPLLTWRKEPA